MSVSLAHNAVFSRPTTAVLARHRTVVRDLYCRSSRVVCAFRVEFDLVVSRVDWVGLTGWERKDRRKGRKKRGKKRKKAALKRSRTSDRESLFTAVLSTDTYRMSVFVRFACVSRQCVRDKRCVRGPAWLLRFLTSSSLSPSGYSMTALRQSLVFIHNITALVNSALLKNRPFSAVREAGFYRIMFKVKTDICVTEFSLKGPERQFLGCKGTLKNQSSGASSKYGLCDR